VKKLPILIPLLLFSSVASAEWCTGAPDQNITTARNNFKTKCGEVWDPQKHKCDHKADGYHCNGNTSGPNTSSTQGSAVSTSKPIPGSTLSSDTSVQSLLAPTGVVAVRSTASSSKPVIKWNKVAGAAGYNLYRNGKYLLTLSGLEYTDLIPPTGTIRYQVAAFDASKKIFSPKSSAAVIANLTSPPVLSSDSASQQPTSTQTSASTSAVSTADGGDSNTGGGGGGGSGDTGTSWTEPVITASGAIFNPNPSYELSTFYDIEISSGNVDLALSVDGETDSVQVSMESGSDQGTVNLPDGRLSLDNLDNTPGQQITMDVTQSGSEITGVFTDGAGVTYEVTVNLETSSLEFEPVESDGNGNVVPDREADRDKPGGAPGVTFDENGYPDEMGP